MSFSGDYRYLVRVGFLAALLPYLAPAQWVSVGVTGGVPISPHAQNSGQGCLVPGPGTCGPNDYLVKPYAIGPTADIHLPWRFSVEVGFLYERFHKDVTQGLTVSRGGYANFGEQYSASADGWLFPFLLKYTFGRRRIVPFAEAGATLRHQGPFDGQGIQLDYYEQPQPASAHIESPKDLDVAITAGAGLRWRIWAVDISPEIRFRHWTSPFDQPAQNEAMLMLGFTFGPAPSRKTR